MHHAAFKGSLEAVKTLLEHGADPNATGLRTYGTPLGCAIRSEEDAESAIALLLIRRGAKLNYRDEEGKTALLQAVHAHRVPVITELLHADVDLTVTDYDDSSVLDLLSIDSEHSCSLFYQFLRFGLPIHRNKSIRYIGSPFHYAICGSKFTSFILNSDVRLDESPTFPWSLVLPGSAWISKAYPYYVKRFGRKSLQKFANLEPSRGWSPLCISASNGDLVMMQNIMDLGAEVNIEGCPYGSALMAACVSGRKECVALLVRRGACVAYHGSKGFRSAYLASEKNPIILHWLLVGRFVDQKKLLSEPHQSSMIWENCEKFTWGGPTKVEMVISGMMERLPKESSRDYWSRLMQEKGKLHGNIPPLDVGRRTSRPSSLIPTEIVKPHKNGSSSRKPEREDRHRDVPQMAFDGLLW